MNYIRHTTIQTLAIEVPLPSLLRIVPAENTGGTARNCARPRGKWGGLTATEPWVV